MQEHERQGVGNQQDGSDSLSMHSPGPSEASVARSGRGSVPLEEEPAMISFEDDIGPVTGSRGAAGATSTLSACYSESALGGLLAGTLMPSESADIAPCLIRRVGSHLLCRACSGALPHHVTQHSILPQRRELADGCLRLVSWMISTAEAALKQSLLCMQIQPEHTHIRGRHQHRRPYQQPHQTCGLTAQLQGTQRRAAG